VLGSAPATSERSTLSLHDALPIFAGPLCRKQRGPARAGPYTSRDALVARGFPGAPRPRTDFFPGCFVRDRVPGLAQVAFDHRPVLAGEFTPRRVEDGLEHGGQGVGVVHWHRQAKGGWPALGRPDTNERSARGTIAGRTGREVGWDAVAPPAGGADLQRVGGEGAAK